MSLTALRWTGLIRLRNLTGHLYLSGVWVAVNLRMNTKKTSCVYKRLDYMLKILLPILDFKSGRNWGTCMIIPEVIMNKSLKYYEENGYSLDLDLLIITH